MVRGSAWRSVRGLPGACRRVSKLVAGAVSQWNTGRVDEHVERHAEVQGIARQAMRLARESIRAGQSLAEVREACERSMLELGADSFWYWSIGAFVFSGEDTVLSVSGRTYETPDRIVSENDLVTIDLSPQRDGVWGDFARTIVVEGGRALDDPLATSNAEWREGLLVERALHAALLEIARPSMTFEELHGVMNERVVRLGFENLDFLGNLGHSIVRRSEDRAYIEYGNRARLDSVGLFTFEPHIRRPGGSFGYKRENIYRFEGERLREL